MAKADEDEGTEAFKQFLRGKTEAGAAFSFFFAQGMYYILDGTRPVPAPDFSTWSAFMYGAGSHARVQVAKTRVTPQIEVSTVFLGLNHSLRFLDPQAPRCCLRRWSLAAPLTAPTGAGRPGTRPSKATRWCAPWCGPLSTLNRCARRGGAVTMRYFVRHMDARCPHCGHPLNSSASLPGDPEMAPPQPGDLTICCSCLGVGVYTPAMRRRAATRAELVAYASRLRQAYADVWRRRGAGPTH
jgi:hypothetical protein